MQGLNSPAFIARGELTDVREENFTKYQNQAIVLGLKNWDAGSVSELLANAVTELKSLPTAGKKRVCSKRLRPDAYYHNEFIVDALNQIRSGHIAYIFSLSHVAEVISFESRSKFKYNPEYDCIEVFM